MSTVRKNCTLPESLVEEVHRVRGNLPFSRYVREALEARLAKDRRVAEVLLAVVAE